MERQRQGYNRIYGSGPGPGPGTRVGVGNTNIPPGFGWPSNDGSDRDRDPPLPGEMVDWAAFPGCPICQANADAGPLPYGTAFPSGDTEPPAHPHCQCVLLQQDDDYLDLPPPSLPGHLGVK